jgi:hypothetical protein
MPALVKIFIILLACFISERVTLRIETKLWFHNFPGEGTRTRLSVGVVQLTPPITHFTENWNCRLEGTRKLCGAFFHSAHELKLNYQWKGPVSFVLTIHLQ